MPHQENSPHPAGEYAHSNKLSPKVRVPVDTFGGRIHVEWDSQAAVTPLGQLSFFIEFLKLARLFEPWVDECPLHYQSNNASSRRDILGTLLLSILSGHTRYSHITSLRGEHINAHLLGMSRIVSEDTARRSLLAMDEEAGMQWGFSHLQKSYLPLLETAWILDIDTTVKTLYGKQEGALVGYNPHKPGRPSHVYHTYFIANIRLILDVDVQDGKSVAGYYSAPNLWQLIASLPVTHRPQFIRGDVSDGTENIMRESEEREVDYLFKLRATPKVKGLISELMTQEDWHNAGQGWEGANATLQLSGWTTSRRVIVLRRAIPKSNTGVLFEDNTSGQLAFSFIETNDGHVFYEYAVLVTSLEDEIITLAQHYRDRADCENNFDELKNQWGISGYTTHDLKRCRIMAKMIALVYNWWNLFVRLVEPSQHHEAITSRPLLLNAVGKLTGHANQKTITIMNPHAKATHIENALTRITHFFKSLKQTAEQLSQSMILRRILELGFGQFMGNQAIPPPLPLPAPT